MLKRKRLEEVLIELQEWCEKNSDYEKKWFLELLPALVWVNRLCKGLKIPGFLRI